MKSVVLRRRKGSAMVESAIVFPIVVFATLSVIYILINLYSEVVVNAKLHMIISEEAGEMSRTVSYGEPWSDDKRVVWLKAASVSTERNKSIFGDEITGSIGDTAEGKGLVQNRVMRSWSAAKDIIDEEEFIRCSDIALGIIKEEAY